MVLLKYGIWIAENCLSAISKKITGIVLFSICKIKGDAFIIDGGILEFWGQFT